MSASCFARLCLAACVVSFCIPAASAAAEGDYSVRDFGAVGDGKADDTAAIQAALDAAMKGPRGSSVLIPPGEYRVTGLLTVENALLTGLHAGGWPADRGRLPTIRVDHTATPCIIAKSAASVNGLNFTYDHQKQEARKFGPTILLSGNGISLTNLRIESPWEGIMADGVTNIGRLNIENVFIVGARECGVYVTNTYDISTLRNIEVWNPPDYSLSHCVGFKLGKNDEIRLDNCFAFKCKTGYLLVAEPKGTTWGGMTGCSADFCVEGVVFENGSLRINGGSFWAHMTAIRLEGAGRVVISGADLKSNGEATVIARGDVNATITGCCIRKSGGQWATAPAAKIEGGKSVLISGCTFGDQCPGIVIGPAVKNVLINDNIFQPCPYEAITDNSGSGTNKVIANNLIHKTEPEAAK